MPTPRKLTSLAKLLPCATAKVKSTEALGFQWYQQSKVQFPKLDLFQTETEMVECIIFASFFSVHFTESSLFFSPNLGLKSLKKYLDTLQLFLVWTWYCGLPPLRIGTSVLLSELFAKSPNNVLGLHFGVVTQFHPISIIHHLWLSLAKLTWILFRVCWNNQYVWRFVPRFAPRIWFVNRSITHQF